MSDETSIPVLARKIEHVAISKIAPHPRNPNRGDLEAIIESVRTTGFWEPILVQRSSGYAISGNHRIEAAVALNMTSLPVVYLDVDDDTAMRIMLAANQTAKRSVYDDQSLAELLAKLALDDVIGLLGTGFDQVDLDLLLDRLDHDPTGTPEAGTVLTPQDRQAGYDASGIRSIILPLAAADYERLIAAFEQLRERMGLATNVEVVVALVEHALAGP